MYLKRLELTGFKSFRNHTILDFTPGVTAIVGPNGSGKSNVMDAIRWVLGEQSLKSLRGKKSEDVIFSGSSELARLNLAEVHLTIDNADQALALDYPEVVISRRLYRDGTSEYLLNGQATRLIDVVLLLAKTNFGQKSYSIVGQGLVDQVINSSPSERKDFFDEATGIKQHQIKRDQAVLKLGHTRENLKTTGQILEELGPRLRSLTRQVHKLEQRERLETELTNLQRQVYGTRLAELDNQRQALQEKRRALDQTRQQQAAAAQALQTELSTLGRAKSRQAEFQQRSERYQQAQTRRQEAERELAKLQTQLGQEYQRLGQAELGFLEQCLASVEQQTRQAESALAEAQQQGQQQSERVQGKQAEQERFLAQVREIEQQLLDLRAAEEGHWSTHELRERLQALEQDFRAFLHQIGQLGQAEPSNALGELPRLRQDGEVLLARLGELQNAANIEERLAQRQELQGKLTDFLKSKDSLVNELRQEEVALAATQAREQELRQRLDGLLAEGQSLRRELERQELPAGGEAERARTLQRQAEELRHQLADAEAATTTAKQELESMHQQEDEQRRTLLELQARLTQAQQELSTTQQSLGELAVELATVEAHRDDLWREVQAELHLTDPSQLSGVGALLAAPINLEESQSQIARLKHQLGLIGGIDPEVTAEYQEVKQRHDFLQTQSDDLNRAVKDLEQVIDQLDEIIYQQFTAGFKKINRSFQEFFQRLFGGGKAELKLVQREIDSDPDTVPTGLVPAENQPADAAAEPLPVQTLRATSLLPEERSPLVNLGIEIHATPPGKKIKSIAMLSGGEKTMTSIALICAVISNNPSPFVIFDEVDAALDEANSARLADIVREMGRRTQFIAITHNRAVMHSSKVLYGVTMGEDGTSRLLSLNLAEAEQMDA